MEINRKIKVALFIPSLAIGGAERQLEELARGLDKSKWDVLVMTMQEGGFGGVLNRVRQEQIDILYCSLGAAQAYALLIKFFSPKLKLVFRIGDAIKSHEYFGFKNSIVNFILKIFADNADFYIFNSQAGQRNKALSLPADRTRVIHNGIDIDRFQPSDVFKDQFRRSIGIANTTILIGCLGNFSIYKDHRALINAASIVRKTHDGVHFLTIGDHDTPLGKAAIDQVKALGLEDRFTFLGSRNDVEKILPALDMGCSSSITEGFPNSICELMACGVPCVVTDAGDSSLIVGDTGFVVAPSNPMALAQGIMAMFQLSFSQRTALGVKARDRIMEHYPLSQMVEATQEVLEGILQE